MGKKVIVSNYDIGLASLSMNKLKKGGGIRFKKKKKKLKYPPKKPQTFILLNRKNALHDRQSFLNPSLKLQEAKTLSLLHDECAVF